MKILFICENYIPHYGGAEVVFKNLAEGYVKLGHKVTLLTHQLKKTKKKEIINGVKVIRVSSFNSRYLFSFTCLIKTIKLPKKHDIIQTTTFNGAPPAWLAAKITNKPVIITVHEVWIDKWQKVTSFPWWKTTMHNLLEKLIYKLNFDKYVCVSNATKKDLLNIGIKENKVERIYNGLEYNFWNPEKFSDRNPNEIRKKLNLQNKFVYFSWGRPGESKGFEYVIKAVPLIKKEIPNSVFVLMLGSAEKYKRKYNQLIDLINKLNLNNDIKIIGPAPHLELGYYLKSFDCAVIPSIAEGFGFNCAEAMSVGIPIVVSNAGSLPEVVSGKHLMFESKNYEDLADKVIKVSRGKYEETPIKKFQWKESINKYLKIYSNLIKG